MKNEPQRRKGTERTESPVRAGVRHAGAFLGGLGAGFVRGVLRWKESTIFLPLALLLFGLICLAVILATGRELLNDLGDMVDFGKACVKLAIAIAMVGWAQESLFGYRTESGPGAKTTKPPLSDDIHDSCVTIALFLLVLLAFGYWL